MSIQFRTEIEVQFPNVTLGFGGLFHRPNPHSGNFKIFFLVVRSQSLGRDGREIRLPSRDYITKLINRKSRL